ncbi:conserved protein of unknown function [Nitrospira japonica]|uniref:Uncharacterized protein n=1 Tax=Nitrospira japonica TaxID=1325564 RepID=A0A1W1I1D6_9BACT|nr:conserved protein of unknown function [Nitrospira japonica]
MRTLLQTLSQYAAARRLAWALVCGLLVACSAPKERESLSPPSPGPLGWEVPPLFSAAGILTPAWLKGPHHSVQDEVVNDGVQYHFVVNSEFGAFPAAGVPMLRTRVIETQAIAELNETRQSEVFVDALKFQLLHPLQGVKILLTEPKRLGSSVGGGVLEFLAMPGQASKFEGSEQEDSMTKSAIGFSYLKRKLAFQFGVDPYSSNRRLQDELNELTWVAFTADLAPQIGYVFMPAPAILWMSFSATRWTSYLDEQVRDHSPGDLRAMDRAKLLAMGISEEDIHRFFLNGHFSPRHATIITAGLDALTGVDNREAFLAVAEEAPSEELVLFYQHLVEMMRGYHVHVGAVDRLLVLPRVPALYTKNKTLVVMLPLDYVFWTPRVASVAQALTTHVPSRPRIARRELWIAGNASPRARQELESLGWTVYEQVSAKLNPEP